MTNDRLGRFERRTAVPMLVLALAIVPLLLVPLVMDLSPAAATGVLIADWVIWSAFAAHKGEVTEGSMAST